MLLSLRGYSFPFASSILPMTLDVGARRKAITAQGASFFHAHLPTQPRRRQSNHRGSSRLLLLRTTAQGAGFESSLEMANTAKIRSITVGIFDNAHDLEQAVAQLASAGFDGTAVYEAAIVAQEPGNVAPVGPVIAPGVVPAEAAGSVERNVRDVPKNRRDAQMGRRICLSVVNMP